MDVILFALWFFLPAGVANMAPVFANKIPGLRKWNLPLDYGRKFRGKRIFGDSKTWRGLLLGIVLATVTLGLQVWAFNNYGWAQDIANNINYFVFPVYILGPLFAIGALGGDALESFFKRQRGLKEGQSWFPFDQLDYIIGGLIASFPIIELTLKEYLAVIIVWFCVHLLFVYIGYVLGVRDAKI
jgi:CDP-2,3-bis-(O-geranylgeranyl)-sn-glycerol synthase